MGGYTHEGRCMGEDRRADLPLPIGPQFILDVGTLHCMKIIPGGRVMTHKDALIHIITGCAVIVLSLMAVIASAAEPPARVGSLIRVRPDHEERYIILHRHTFPEVLAQIRDSNIRNYSIFLLDGVLFSHFEYIGNDFEKDMDRMAQDKVTQEWWKLTEPMQRPFEDRKEGEWWTVIDEIFHLAKREKTNTGVQRFGFLIEAAPGREEACISHISGMPGPVRELLGTTGIQNLSVFYRNGTFYSYIEYSGNDFLGDIERIVNHEGIRDWKDGFRGKLKEGPSTGISRWWQPMEEVFHTD